MVSSKACKFRDHAPAGTTAMTNAESDEKKDGRRVTRLRDRAHPTVSRLVTLAYGQGGRTL
jgi:hypothetical protein